MGRLSLKSKLGLHLCRMTGLRRVHREFEYGGVERGSGKKWMG